MGQYSDRLPGTTCPAACAIRVVQAQQSAPASVSLSLHSPDDEVFPQPFLGNRALQLLFADSAKFVDLLEAQLSISHQYQDQTRDEGPQGGLPDKGENAHLLTGNESLAIPAGSLGLFAKSFCHVLKPFLHSSAHV